MNEWISKCICRETGCVQFLSDFLFIFASARKYMRCTCAFKDEVGLCASAVHKSSGLQCKGALPYAPTSHHFQLGKTSRKNIFTYPKTGHADTEHFGNEQTLNSFTSVSLRLWVRVMCTTQHNIVPKTEKLQRKMYARSVKAIESNQVKLAVLLMLSIVQVFRAT